MRRLLVAVLFVLALQPWLADVVRAFCGFYVAKADATIFNHASQVVLVRDGNRTVLTMANDFKGSPTEFAVVIPVPTFIQREQIHVAEKALIDHLDAYSAPRLVEYFDENPCVRFEMQTGKLMAASPVGARADAMDRRGRALGVAVEAQYTVGEYDILILSAKESTGLETWLKENGYRIPAGASSVLGSYIRLNMRFFVARVNLKEQSRLGFTYLRPLQVAYESPKFMLPIRLGTVNANGAQELFIYALTRNGRVETTNYRTVRLPTGIDLPPFIKNDFVRFYRAMFDEQVRREDMRVVFLEYAWDMGWCDPCAADPLSSEELRNLGVFWTDDAGPVPASQSPRRPRVILPQTPQAQNAFVTRLHVRYDGAHFPEDLVYQETGDRDNFQGRYVLRHAWTGGDTCTAAAEYRRALPARREHEAQALSALTGWRMEEIRKRAGTVAPAVEDVAWWKRIWQ
jgi:hypothetical protein